MRTPSAQIKKKAAHFFGVASNITLIASVFMFFVCIIQGIPLKYMTGFIVLYAVTAILYIFLAQNSPQVTEKSVPKKSLISLYLVSNIASIIIVMILIRRYELQEYIVPIISSSIIVINLIIIEFHMQTFSKFFSTKGGNWLLRTLLLVILCGGSIYAYNSLIRSPIDISITGAPAKTSSETTGTISTLDSVPEQIRSIQIETTPEESAEKSETQISTPKSTQNEATGILTTEDKKDVTIESIESVDGKMSAKIQDGQIIVEVIPPEDTPDTTTISKSVWSIEGIVNSNQGGGALQGVVISAPKSSMPPGKYTEYQDIKLSADGASGIFFTIDGSLPSCSGNGVNNIATVEKTITIKSISCFGGNKIRGPVSIFTFSIE